MYDTESRSMLYAGVATKNPGTARETYSFHCTAKKGGDLGVWTKLPGVTTFQFIKLPRKMTRIEACRYLYELKGVKHEVRLYLQKQITGMAIRKFLQSGRTPAEAIKLLPPPSSHTSKRLSRAA